MLFPFLSSLMEKSRDFRNEREIPFKRYQKYYNKSVKWSITSLLVKAEFQNKNDIFCNFFDYFELTWIRGNYFKLTDWNYYRALNYEESSVEFSKNFHITNNAVESCNAILNSCLHRGYLRELFSENII